MYWNQPTIIYESDYPCEVRNGLTLASLFEVLDSRFEFGDGATRQ